MIVFTPVTLARVCKVDSLEYVPDPTGTYRKCPRDGTGRRVGTGGAIKNQEILFCTPIIFSLGSERSDRGAITPTQIPLQAISLLLALVTLGNVLVLYDAFY